MDKGEMYDAASDVEGIFSSAFRSYVRDKQLISTYRDYKSSCSWLFVKEQLADDVDSAVFDSLNNLMALGIPIGCNYLVQFWKPEEVSDCFGESRFMLSTRNQPFLIEGTKFQVREKICSYRMKMDDIEIGDEGVIGRVFRNKRMEFSPNIGYYSNEEYPLRDLAISCRIRCSLVIPLSDSSGSLVGVLEMVSNNPGYIPLMSCLTSQLWSRVKYLDYCKHLHGQYDSEDKSLHMALSEIDEVMKVVGESCGLVGAQTWILCNHCGSLSISKSLLGVHHASYENDFYLGDEFFEPEYVSTLKKGEGVVGQAVTQNMVYCYDVSQFCITEYPLAHIVRHHGLTSCLAICLKSDLTGSHIYVLELFLYQSKVNEKGLTATLIPILEVMRQNFRTFKVASGENISSTDLSVHVIDARYRHIHQTVKSSDLNEENVVLNIGEKGFPIAHSQQRNSSKFSSNKPGGQLAISVMDAISLQDSLSTDHLAMGEYENVSNNNHACISNYEQASVVGSSRQPPVQVNVHTEESVTGPSEELNIHPFNVPERKGSISKEELLEHFGKTRTEAARLLGVSIAKLKRACRENEIYRWPVYRRNIEHRSGLCSSAQTSSTGKSSDATVQSDYGVIIKAKYGDKIIQFPLSSASGIDVFHEQIKKRLQLEAETYSIKFQDADYDFISIICDEDLREFIHSSILLGKTTLTLFIENVAPVLGSSHMLL